MHINQRIAALRHEMKRQGIDACVILDSDPHLQPYIAPHWMQREWISGFSGSAGSVVVTRSVAGLWTDVRYFAAAEESFADNEFVLFKDIPGTSQPQHEWLAEQLPAGSTVALCGGVVSEAQRRLWQEALNKADIKLRIDIDLVGALWPDRPKLTFATIYKHELKYAGEDRKQKLNRVCAELARRGATAHLIADPSQISWLLNLRGGDVLIRTVFTCWLLLEENRCVLYCKLNCLPEDLCLELLADGVTCVDYDEFEGDLGELRKSHRLLVDPAKINCQVWQVCKIATLVEAEDIVPRLRMIKNETEQQNFYEALRQDGVAMVKFWHWLYRELASGNDTISEITCRDKLGELRSQRPGYVHDSFDAIVGYAAHGASAHYAVTEETNQPIRKESLFLLDSGGAYLNGTTDTTRVFPMGEITSQMKMDYTLVLKGVISMTTAVFPEGTDVYQMDALARAPIWRGLRLYGHGTGHGVGMFNEIHEPPVFTKPNTNVKLEPGVVMTVEPGTYREGEYGIRIENMLLCRTVGESEFGTFCGFDTLTRCPINTSLIDKSLMSLDEVQWLNEFNRKTCEDLIDELDVHERQWLESQCQPI